MQHSIPHTDIRPDSWIDRFAPPASRPYLRLARLDRPIGTWLLLFPCWWSTALALTPDRWLEGAVLFGLFGIGAVAMRGAGCTINDIFDRDIDAQVERTRSRPLPSGQISVKQALAFVLVQCAIGALVLAFLPRQAQILGLAAMLLVIPYPLMKRITWWPQAWLGLTFNWGALVGWTAVRGELGLPAVLLYVGGVFWTLGYDTIYAHQDKDDDTLIGVKSTALRLGAQSRLWIAGFYALALAFWVGALAVAAPSLASLAVWLVGLAAAALHLFAHLRAWRMDDPADSLYRFKAQRWSGWLLLLGLLAGLWLR
jgi:4-hydroxybenzoate polyprenyltransferase